MNHCGASVNLIVIKNGKVLLIRRISNNWANGKLQIPGGKVENGESPTQAIIREAEEELSIQLTKDDIEPLGPLFVNNEGNEYYAMQFRLKHAANFTYIIGEPTKCSELVWADISSLPNDTIEIFKIVIDGMINNKKVAIEYGY